MSAPRGAESWIPMGSPSVSQPQGRTSAGSPVRLKTAVNRPSSSPSGVSTGGVVAGAVNGAAGVISTSMPWYTCAALGSRPVRRRRAAWWESSSTAEAARSSRSVSGPYRPGVALHLVAMDLPGLPEQDVVEGPGYLGQHGPVHVDHRKRLAHPGERVAQGGGDRRLEGGVLHPGPVGTHPQRRRGSRGALARDRGEDPGGDRDVGGEQAGMVRRRRQLI